jgi:hypothetical protein
MWILFLFSFRVLAENPAFHSETGKVESTANEKKDLTDSCKMLAKDLGFADKKFPLSDIKSIEGLVTWRASRCERPPRGDGIVTQLCDAELASGKGIFFWEKKMGKEKLEHGFFICN